VRALTEAIFPNFDEYYPIDKSINPTKAAKQLDDRTILHELCTRGQADIVSILLDTQQINMEALDKDGNTPLHIACKRNQEECVKLLLQNGAPPNLSNFKGDRALHLTTKENVGRWLIAYGARLELTNQSKLQCREHWKGDVLDKYVVLKERWTAKDCRICESIAENNVWFDDKLSDACLLCGSKFTFTSRKHHCRSCGLLVCQSCSARKLQFSKEGKMTMERACDKCFNKNHSKLLRKKQYSFKEKSYTMTPKEFMNMIVMETTMGNSYFTMKKAMERKENGDVDLDNGFDEEKKMDDEVNKNGNIKKIQQHKESNHKMSKSVNWGFKSHKKKDKDDKFSKHESSHSQAMNETNKALNKVNERGEKLSELADKSERMADSAKNFNDLAKQLANKKW